MAFEIKSLPPLSRVEPNFLQLSSSRSMVQVREKTPEK